MKYLLYPIAFIVIFGSSVSTYHLNDIQKHVVPNINPNDIGQEYVEAIPIEYKRSRRSPNAQHQQNPFTFNIPQKPYDGTKIYGQGGHSSSGTDINLQVQQRLW